MSDFSKSADNTTHVNTVVLHKVRIFFQVYPGISGTIAHRGIPGVEYQGKVGKTVFFGITDEMGAAEFNMSVGETATLEIFETVYTVTLKTSLRDLQTKEGARERLSILGYYTGAITGEIDGETDLAVLNFQADSSIYAQGYARGTLDGPTNDKFKKIIGE